MIDIYPTILEAVGVQSPSMINGVPQKPVEGFRMAYTFDNPKAKSVHATQYFEMFANRALYKDGWVAATTPPVPWSFGTNPPAAEDYKWGRNLPMVGSCWLFTLWFAKILADLEINNLAAALPPLFCYS